MATASTPDDASRAQTSTSGTTTTALNGSSQNVTDPSFPPGGPTSSTNTLTSIPAPTLPTAYPYPNAVATTDAGSPSRTSVQPYHPRTGSRSGTATPSAGPSGPSSNPNGPSFLAPPPAVQLSYNPQSTVLANGAGSGRERTPGGPNGSDFGSGSGSGLGSSTVDGEVMRRKRKWKELGYDDDEITSREGTLASYQLAILQDQQSTLYPSAPTAFTSDDDVIDRLLPYHIWQIHDEELLGQEGTKKEAARVFEEIKEAESLMSRVNQVEERFIRARRREGMYPSHLPSLIKMINNSTQILRDEVATVQADLRTARSEFESLESARREKERLTSSSLPSIPSSGSSSAAAAASAIPTTNTAFTTTTQGGLTPTNSTPQRHPPTPMGQSGPSSSVSNTPKTTSTPERGRPRGRPRGSGRGGLRQTATPHITGAGATPTSTPGQPVRTPQQTQQSQQRAGIPTPSVGLKQAVVGAVGAGGGTATPKTAQMSPEDLMRKVVNINVPKSGLGQLANVGLISSGKPVPPGGKPPPATVRGDNKDGKSVTMSISFSICTKVQLETLAKVLNVNLKPPGATPGPGPGAGTGVGSPSQSGTAPPAVPASATATGSADAATAGAPSTSTQQSNTASTPIPSTSGPKTTSATASNNDQAAESPARSDPVKRTRSSTTSQGS